MRNRIMRRMKQDFLEIFVCFDVTLTVVPLITLRTRFENSSEFMGAAKFFCQPDHLGERYRSRSCSLPRIVSAAFPRRMEIFQKNRRPERITGCIRGSAFHSPPSPCATPPSCLYFHLFSRVAFLGGVFARNSDPVSFHPSRFTR